MFFVATADQDGRINLSPKGLDSLVVLDPSNVLWLNLTGSGNETAAHLLKVNRMTLMFCSFDEQPLILRLYGTSETFHNKDEEWSDLLSQFPNFLGARNIFKLNIDSVQTSCGFAVPEYTFKGQRSILKDWAEKKGDDGIKQYWKDKNVTSIDGLPTGIFEK
ncbi:MAG: pyridoxamine 5'-phosphate oxidase family protein [Bacteroidota bacterium]